MPRTTEEATAPDHRTSRAENVQEEGACCVWMIHFISVYMGIFRYIEFKIAYLDRRAPHNVAQITDIYQAVKMQNRCDPWFE